MTLFLYSRIDTPWEWEKMHHYLSLLPKTMQQQVQQHHRWEDQQTALAGKILLLRGLPQFGLKPSLNGISYTKYHRPFLEGSVDFNLSHSENYSACVLSDEAKVGIDIEYLRPVNLERFKSLWNEEEWNAITEAPSPHRQLYTFWTQKEAVVKADGRGLYINPREISVCAGQTTIAGITWHLRPIAIEEEYIAHMASSTNIAELAISQVNL